MLPKKNAVIGIIFAIPVLCSLIGTGAFILLVTPPVEALDQDGPKPATDNLEDIMKNIELIKKQIEQQKERSRLLQEIKTLMQQAQWSLATILEKEPDVTRTLVQLQAHLQSPPSGDEEQVLLNQDVKENTHGE